MDPMDTTDPTDQTSLPVPPPSSTTSTTTTSTTSTTNRPHELQMAILMEKLYQAEVDKKKKPQGPQDEMRKKVSFELTNTVKPLKNYFYHVKCHIHSTHSYRNYFEN
jgi:hypothetical protein